MLRRVLVGAAFALVLLAGSRAEAAKCTVSSTAVVFGVYNVFSSAPVDSTGTVRYNCGNGVDYVAIAISKGQAPSFFPRTLKKGTESLGYNLYRDAARTTVWGDSTGGTSFYLAGDPPNNRDVIVTIYGRIPPLQDISAGAYSDSVTLTILF